MPEVNVNAVVERVVEVEQPPVEEPQGVPTYVATVYDYPLSNGEVLTLSADEHLQVTHAPDPTVAFYLVWEGREPTPQDQIDGEQAAQNPEPEAEVDATPAAVEEAKTADIDLNAVEGTGKDDRVTKADVVAAEKSDDPPLVDHDAPEAPSTGDAVPVETEDEPPAPPASAQTDNDGPAPDRQV